jgi:DNA-directed RNA polymerase sigma subunit (sigma70/sigma32)
MMRRKSKKMDLYEYTLEETAKELGCSPERVQQILNEAIAKIRRNPEYLEILREYMDWSRERRQAEGYAARYGVRV